MGRNAKINLDLLEQMISQEGKSLTECAKHFNVSISAISQQRKKLGLAIVKNAVAEHASVIVQKKFNQIDQLEKINSHANWLLDHVMKWIKGDDAAIQVLEACTRKVNVGTKKNPVFIDKVKFKDPHQIALKSMAEIRGQLGLQLDIFKTLYDAEVVRDFMREIVEFLADVDPELRNLFIDKVRHMKVLSETISTI